MKYLWWQIMASLLWGLFFILAPFEVLLFGCLLWVPILIISEKRWIQKCGFSKSFFIRNGIIALIISVAVVLPVKNLDRHIGVIQHNSITLKELAERKVFICMERQSDLLEKTVVTFSNANPTRRDVVKAIREQTPYKVRLLSCPNGCSLLLGSHITILISLS
jgi:hypothetical protein